MKALHRPPRRVAPRLFQLLALLLCSVVLASPAVGQESPDTTGLRSQIEQVGTELEGLWVEVFDLFERYTAAEGEERLIIDAQIDRRTARLRPALAEYIQLILRLEQAGGTAPAHRATATQWLGLARDAVRDEYQSVQDQLSALRVQRQTLTREEMLPLERQIGQVGNEVDALLLALYRVGTWRGSMGLDSSSDWDYLDPQLRQRAERLVGEIELSRAELAVLGDRLERASGAEERTVLGELTALQERLGAGTTGLGATVGIMDQREIDTAEYKQLLIRATGQITTDVFNVDVARGLVREGWSSFVAWMLSRAPQMFMNFLLFVLILVVFWILSRVVGRVVSATMTRTNPNMPKLLKTMGVSIVANAVFLVGILIGLSQLGIHVGPVLAGLGVVGFIVGFALQDTLSNFASGMMILVYRPFDVGDVVEAGGVGGKVADMSLVSTTVLTFDNQKLIIPNREIWGNVIRNKTSEKTRRVDMTVSVGDRADVTRAIELLSGILKAHPKVLVDPAPAIQVNALGDLSSDLIVRPWVNTPDYWSVYWDITRQMNDRLEEAGISRPFSRSELRIAEGSPLPGGLKEARGG